MASCMYEEKLTVEYNRKHNEGPCNLYSSENIIKALKSGFMRWEVHVARMEENLKARH